MVNINQGEIRQQLYEMRQELLETLSEEMGFSGTAHQEQLTEDVSELSVFDNHPGDLGSEQFEREKDLTIAGFEKEKLHEIEAALARMQRGNYGYCQKCGIPINGPRLQAIPYARFCISCSEL